MGEPTALVLVVEDLEDTRDLVSDVLAAAGFQVVGAQNGIDAVDSAVKLLPDLILMDLSLPVMGGCEAARLLKSDTRTCDIPIVAVTGWSSLLEQARAAGCDAFLVKPCEPNRLIGEVRRFLRLPVVRVSQN